MAKGMTAPAPVDDYQAESDHGTLARAQEIQAAPKRMAAVKGFHRKKMKAMAGVGKALSGGGKFGGR